jgi:cation/acetate symporter
MLDANTWIVSFGNLGRVSICGFTGDKTHEVLMTAQAIFAACQAGGITELIHTAFAIQPDVVVIATPEIAGLPYVIAGLVAAGGLAAALSTADGLLLAIANALSHDVYYRMIDPEASTHKRLVVSRILLVVVAVMGATMIAFFELGNILALVSYAFSLAAGGLFPALVMGVWWTRTSKQGAIAGMIAGFGVTLLYILWTHKLGFDQPELWGVKNISAGIFGIPVAFIVTYIVSMITPAPSAEMQAFVRELRIPSGKNMMEEKV